LNSYAFVEQLNPCLFRSSLQLEMLLPGLTTLLKLTINHR